MDATDRIRQIITPAVEDMGYEIVRVQISGTHRPVLQVMAERTDGQAMTVDDCADISRAASALLDVEDPIHSAYTLEVSSPGIDRPLTRPGDFERFAGFEARIETRLPVEGRRRFRGHLRGIENGRVRVETQDGAFEIPYDAIQRAKLILTQELIDAATKPPQ
jgi:ribosome maturation factor RimP